MWGTGVEVVTPRCGGAEKGVWKGVRKSAVERCRGVIKMCRGGQKVQECEQKVHRGWHDMGKRCGGCGKFQSIMGNDNSMCVMGQLPP